MKTFGHLGRRSCFNSFSRRWMFGCQNGWMSWSMLKILHAENMYRRTRRESQLNDFLAVTQISCKGWIFVKTLTINVAKGSTPHVNHILSDRLEKKNHLGTHKQAEVAAHARSSAVSMHRAQQLSISWRLTAASSAEGWRLRVPASEEGLLLSPAPHHRPAISPCHFYFYFLARSLCCCAVCVSRGVTVIEERRNKPDTEQNCRIINTGRIHPPLRDLRAAWSFIFVEGRCDSGPASTVQVAAASEWFYTAAAQA